MLEVNTLGRAESQSIALSEGLVYDLVDEMRHISTLFLFWVKYINTKLREIAISLLILCTAKHYLLIYATL